MNQKLDEITTNILTILLVLMPIAIFPIGDFNYNIIRKHILLICGAILLIIFLLKLRKTKFHLEDCFIFVFLIFATISTAFSLNVKQSIFGAHNRYEGILSIITYILIYFHAKNSFQEFKSFKIIIITTYVMISCVAIFQYYMPSNIGTEPMFGKGAHGTIGNTNFMGSFISILLPFSMLTYILKNKKSFLSFSILSFTVMIMCVARSSWVAFVCYMLFIVIYLIIKKNKDFWKRFLILCITFIISFSIIIVTKKNDSILNKFGSIKRDMEYLKENGITNNMGSNRIEIWKMTIKVIQKRPLIGCGVDALEFGLEKYAPKENFNYIFKHGNFINKAHNEYLQIAATMGIPALIIYLIFLGTIIIPNIKNILKNDETMILLTIIFSYLIQAFFNISVIPVAPLFWFTLGIASRYKMN